MPCRRSSDNSVNDVIATSAASEQITGSTTGANVLVGSTGNDTITGTSSTTAADTIATGGGVDVITLAPDHTAADHIELYGGSGLLANNGAGGDGGTIVSAAPDGIVDPHDNAQPGWWGVNTDGLNAGQNNHNAIGEMVLAFGQGQDLYGTAADASTVANFVAGRDVVDVSVGAFASLLSNLDKSGSAAFDPVTVPAATATTAYFTQAIFTAPVAPGAEVNYAAGAGHANVLLLGTTFANAEAVAQSLGGAGSAPTALAFLNGLTLSDLGSAQPGGLDYAGHVLLAYANSSGEAVIADLDIAATAPVVASTEAGPHADAIDGRTITETIGVSDLVTLTGVPLASLQAHDIHFVA